MGCVDVGTRDLPTELGVECFVKTALVRVEDHVTQSEVGQNSAGNSSVAAVSSARTSSWSRTSVGPRSFVPEYHQSLSLRGDGNMVALQVWHRPALSAKQFKAESRASDQKRSEDVLLGICLIPLPLQLGLPASTTYRGWFPLFCTEGGSDVMSTNTKEAVGGIEVELSRPPKGTTNKTVREEILGVALLSGPDTEIQIVLGEVVLPSRLFSRFGFQFSSVSLRYTIPCWLMCRAHPVADVFLAVGTICLELRFKLVGPLFEMGTQMKELRRDSKCQQLIGSDRLCQMLRQL